MASSTVHAVLVRCRINRLSHLDRATGGAVMDLLFELHDRRDTTLVLVTHDERLAERTERIVRLFDGRVSGPADPKRSAGLVW